MCSEHICKFCDRPYSSPKGCTPYIMEVDGVKYNSIPYGEDGKGDFGPFCPDCGTPLGETHHSGCDIERCPCCHMQYISCSCYNEHTINVYVENQCDSTSE